jgi:hypothetical protein
MADPQARHPHHAGLARPKKTNHLHHPGLKTGPGRVNVRPSFVASGTRTDNYASVIARVTGQGAPVYGRQIHRFCSPRWAFYFSQLRPNTAYTLEVWGITLQIDAQGNITEKAERIGSQDIMTRDVFGAIDITWPPDQDTTDQLCASNFVPYGTYAQQGTIRATLVSQSGTINLVASSVNQDPYELFWSAQFDDFSANIDPLHPDPCTLRVYLTPPGLGDIPAQPSTGLVFDAC